MYLDVHAVSHGSQLAQLSSDSSIMRHITYVAPAKNMSMVLARATADNPAISRMVVNAMTKIRRTRLLEVRHMRLGVNRKATTTQAVRARATMVIMDPEKICTFGSLEVPCGRGYCYVSAVSIAYSFSQRCLTLWK